MRVYLAFSSQGLRYLYKLHEDFLPAHLIGEGGRRKKKNNKIKLKKNERERKKKEEKQRKTKKEK